MLFREGRFFKFILLFIIAVLFFGFVVMSLWNSVLTPVLHVTAINFGQAIGLLILSKILFGGFRGGGWRGRHGSHMWGIRQKWESMTPEEREKFKAEWKNRCSRWRTKDFSETNDQNSPS